MTQLFHFRESILGNFSSPVGYFFWGWILTYAFVGTLLNLRADKSLLDAFKACFAKKEFWGPSAKLDYKIFLISNGLILYPLGLFLTVHQDAVAATTERWLSPMGWHIRLSNGLLVDSIYTILLLFAADLGWTIQHILFHRVPCLWELHKVHHSATELNIFTIARLHPFDALLQGWAAAMTTGIFMGLCKSCLGYSPSLVQFMNVSAAMALFRVLGIFRHSHIWISYGPFLSHFFGSPAMHQIHHSDEERHHDKNFAVVFSFWDWIFGTLYIPTTVETLRFGITTEKGEILVYDSFLGSLLQPLLPNKLLRRSRRHEPALLRD